MGLCHSLAPLRKKMLASTGAMTMANTNAPIRAKVTVQAIGLKSRPSTACSVKIGRYEVIMMPRAKKTGRSTSCAASRIFCAGVRVSSLWREVADHIFDHHHRAIHHHAEVQRAQRKQVGGNMTQVETDGGEQQRKGNGEGNDDCAAHVAQKEKENDRDQDHAHGQVVLNSLNRKLHQIGAVEERHHLHALGQNAWVIAACPTSS